MGQISVLEVGHQSTVLISGYEHESEQVRGLRDERRPDFNPGADAIRTIGGMGPERTRRSVTSG
jgi:hypothetical protein